MVKKYLMVQIWRMQQSQALISIFFWSLTLAGVYYLSYFHPLFTNLGLPENDVAIGTIILFFLIVIAFLFLGLIYDKFLRLWREQTDIAVERNPYAVERLQPKEIVQWKRFNVSVMRELAKKDSALQADIDFMERWIAKSLAERPDLRESVAGLEKWVMG